MADSFSDIQNECEHFYETHGENISNDYLYFERQEKYLTTLDNLTMHQKGAIGALLGDANSRRVKKWILFGVACVGMTVLTMKGCENMTVQPQQNKITNTPK
jgi:hypothetical protein